MEEQEEEYEVLDSIYGSGDENFKALSHTVFQYKVQFICIQKFKSYKQYGIVCYVVE